MKLYKYVAVILVYRNVQDLIECIESFYKTIDSCKLIVVNSFFDSKSSMEIKTIAETNNCDFIEVENKGYSYGNNQGIKFAKEHYTFEYIIISNPDIIVKKFTDVKLLFGDKKKNIGAIAPRIVTVSGKMQNPMHVIENRLAEFLIYKGMKLERKLLLTLGIGLNKIIRECWIQLFKLKRQQVKKIYSAHGSFVLISNEAIKALDVVYDENMFLFAEEMVLATKLKKEKFDVIYTEEIEVMHKEDGSMKLSDFSLNSELQKSNIYFYETYRNGA